MLLRSLAALAILLLARVASAEPLAPAPVTLRARSVESDTLIAWVSDEYAAQRRSLVVGPEASRPVTLDVEGSIPDVQDAIVRASGAGTLALGRATLVGGPGRLRAARASAEAERLASGGYRGRRVTAVFHRIRLLKLLGLLADVSKRRIEVAEGVEQRITVAVANMPWDEVVDALAAACGLTVRQEGVATRLARRDDVTPRFSPIALDLSDEPRPTPRAFAIAAPGHCNSPLTEVELGELKVTAVLAGVRQPGALVRLPAGDQFLLRWRSCVGVGRGEVVRIATEGIVVAEAGVERTLPLVPAP